MTTTDVLYPIDPVHPDGVCPTDPVYPPEVLRDPLPYRAAEEKKSPLLDICLILFLILMFMALVLMVIGTPLDMYKLSKNYREIIYPELGRYEEKTMYITAWGSRNGGRSSKYYDRDFTTSFCSTIHHNFRAVQAFCIITIGLMTISLILGVLALLRLVSKYVVGAIAVLTMLACIVPWAIIAGMYHKQTCRNYTIDSGANSSLVRSIHRNLDIPRFKTMSSYGAGFGLLVASWCLSALSSLLPFFAKDKDTLTEKERLRERELERENLRLRELELERVRDLERARDLRV